MQAVEDHDTDHLNRARQMFPADPEILFLSGSQRETYAGPAFRARCGPPCCPPASRLPSGVVARELREAEGFCVARSRSSRTTAKPGSASAACRGLLGRPCRGRQELREALASAGEDLLRYYGELFLGAAEEALGRYDAAFDAYQRAAALYPTAQSPLLALSSLARRRGDRAGVLGALRQLFALPVEKPDRDDPWWTYHVEQAQARRRAARSSCASRFATEREP